MQQGLGLRQFLQSVSIICLMKPPARLNFLTVSWDQTHRVSFAKPLFCSILKLLGYSMLSCLGDSAIPIKDRTEDARLRLNEVITMSGQGWRLTRVWSSQRQFERGRAEDWLAARTTGPDFASECDSMYVCIQFVSSPGASCIKMYVCPFLLEGFATFMTFLPVLVYAGSGSRNLRRQKSSSNDGR
jgi:hypothetical protein